MWWASRRNQTFVPASLSGRPRPSAHGPRPPFTLCQLEFSLNCRLRPSCGAIVSEFRPRIHVAGHGGDATSPAPNVAPCSQKLRPHGAKLGAKTPFSTHLARHFSLLSTSNSPEIQIYFIHYSFPGAEYYDPRSERCLATGYWLLELATRSNRGRPRPHRASPALSCLVY